VRSAPWWSSCPCPREPCRPCGRTTTASSNPTWKSFPGYYKTADAGYIDEEGYAYVMAAPTTSSTWPATACPPGAMEEVLSDHPDVAECAVLGVEDSLKGQVPHGLPGAQGRCDGPARSSRKWSRWCATASVRWRHSRPPRWSSGCPRPVRARSCAGTIQKIADNKDYKVPATIDDPTILGEMEEALEGIGYATQWIRCFVQHPAFVQMATTLSRPWLLAR
jgi:propionyl-CoA synthetase